MTDKPRSLGQMAFEAFHNWYAEVTAPEDRRDWDGNADVCDQAAWEAAAAAIADEVRKRESFGIHQMAKSCEEGVCFCECWEDAKP